MNISWEKVACALLAGALALSGWGLYMVHHMDVKLGRIEAKMEVWHTPIGGDQVMFANNTRPATSVQDDCEHGWVHIDMDDGNSLAMPCDGTDTYSYWSTGGPDLPLPAAQGMFAGYSPCEQRLEFLQRASVRAYNSVKQQEYDAALRTIILGLEEAGMYCKEYRSSLRCE